MSSLSSAAVPAPAAGSSLRLARLGDELLARYAARGSDRAFAALYERYHQKLYRYCRSILRNDVDAQDALQSTFTGALAALRRDRRNAPLRPWLFRIAHNEAISLLRRRSRDAADELRDEDFRAGSSVDQEAADRARWRTLVEDLGGLPDRQRGALLLRELSGLSHDEIAIALGTTTAGAKQAIFEARQALAEIEEGRAMRCEEVRQRISEGDRRVLRGRKVTAHLRDCSACDVFATALPARRAELRAFTPVLPAAAAAALLSRSLHTAPVHGGAGGASAAAGAGAAGKAAGGAVAWKSVAGVAVAITTAAGVTGIAPLIHHSSSSPAAHGAGAAAGGGNAALLRHAHSPLALGAQRGAGHPVSAASAGKTALSVRAVSMHTASRGAAIGSTAGSHRARGRSGSAPGRQPASAARGHSGSAPGHQTAATGPGHSRSAPGHRAASTSSGRSVSAVGHQAFVTGSGRSVSAVGHQAVVTDSGRSASSVGHQAIASVPVSAVGGPPDLTGSGQSAGAAGHL